MASPAIKSNVQVPSSSPARGTRPEMLSSLYGLQYATYQTKPQNFILSFVLHMLALVLIVLVTTYIAQHPKEIKQELIKAIDISPYLPSTIGGPSGGGGGGGDRDKLVASKGALPKSAPDQITPPTVVVKTEPKIPIAPTVVAPPMVANLPQMGDPLA